MSPSENRLVLDELEKSARLFISLKTGAEAEIDAGSSRLGGTPLLPAGMAMPTDKSGNALNFVGQLNFADFDLSNMAPVETGLLSIFLSDRHRLFPAKDASCFKIIWQPDYPDSPNLVSLARAWQITGSRQYLLATDLVSDLCTKQIRSEIQSWIGQHNSRSVGDGYLMLDEHPRLSEGKEISAFSANGITYNQARAADSCYKHLIEAASDWRLLWKLTLSDGTDLLLMVRADDWEGKLLQKSWLVRFFRE